MTFSPAYHQRPRGDTPVSIKIRWKDGGLLSLSFEGDGGPLLAVSRRYGSDALAHLWACIVLHWTSYRSLTDFFPWFPSEHLWLLGLSGDHDYEQMHRYLARLAGAELTATYLDFRSTCAPLVLLGAREKDGRGRLIAGSMQVHPALAFPAVAGGRWWLARLNLFRSIPTARAPIAAAPLAVCMGQQWSITAKRGKTVFRKAVPALAEAIGRPMRGDRKRDGRTVEQLREAAGALQKAGYVGRFELTSEVLTAWPAESRAFKPLRPPLLPATGNELKVWLAGRGGSAASNARAIGCTARTLRNAVKRGHRYLSPELRTKLREYLWPSRDPEK